MAATSLLRLNAGFLVFWTLLLTLCWFNSYDDPSSVFYDEERGFQLRHSRQRAAEADVFLRHIPPKLPPDHQQLLCIGVPSINRTTQSFLSHTLATLTDTLTPQDRASIHLVVLLADRPSSHHSAYGQEWIERLADEILVYDQPPAVGGGNSSIYRSVPFDLVPGRPRGTGRVENMRLDHSLLFETCRNHSADYFALVEDDIIASRDWFARMKKGLAYVEARTSKTKQEWLYLRLFFSELLMGWNSEEWLAYATHIFLAYAAALVLFLAARKRFRLLGGGGAAGSGDRAQTYRHVTALAFGLWLPALIALYFLAGRVSVARVNPLAWWGNPRGVREMSDYGCCAQGLVFPRRRLDGVFELMRNPPYDFPGDMILEGYAGDKGLKKWALDPSVFQHVGFTESSEGPRIAEVWNFSFERMKPGGGWNWGWKT
ncbi:Integral membrane protein [Coniochaeta hoffmannii]|uniref:Integral membrane protein n=1 Tax=Coniochaeta hoffmannii TaxID=91930 RepID=A0AA38RM29_9PEZI|nr:Integral membrane protein [Coniochaeta hoffmannii]